MSHYDGDTARFEKQLRAKNRELEGKRKRERRIYLSIIGAALLTLVFFFSCDHNPAGNSGDEAMMTVTSAEVFPIIVSGTDFVVCDIEGNEVEPVFTDFQNIVVDVYPDLTGSTIGITIDGSMNIDVVFHPSGNAPLGVN